MAGTSSGSMSRGRQGFTLIELMIVVTIIATLIAILLPSLARAREQAKAVKCLSNLNTLFKGIFYYTNDASDGNGYLPQLGRGEGYWANQIRPYVKIRRSQVGAKNGLLVCPADPEPRYRWITRGPLPGNWPGAFATLADKILADTGVDITVGAGLRRRGLAERNMELGPLIEPVSYIGSCDTLVWRLDPGQAGYGRAPSKWTELKSPHCSLLLTEVSGYCIRWEDILGTAESDPSFRRHYGKTSTLSNGSNFLFGDGHAQWNSARFAGQHMICCADFGGAAYQRSYQYVATLQREQCDPPATPEGITRR